VQGLISVDSLMDVSHFNAVIRLDW
jgi:hypothetical protein